MFVTIIFFFNDTATTEIYTLSLHDALPIYAPHLHHPVRRLHRDAELHPLQLRPRVEQRPQSTLQIGADRKSTRLNSSHANISYAVFCLKKKKITKTILRKHYTLYGTLYVSP